MMAVAALLARGMLTVLAGGLSTTMNVAMANMPAQSKVSWGVCMAILHYGFGAPINWQTALGCYGAALGTTAFAINRSPVWWGFQLDMRIGQAVFTALRLSRFAGVAAGPIGALVMIGLASRK